MQLRKEEPKKAQKQTRKFEKMISEIEKDIQYMKMDERKMYGEWLSVQRKWSMEVDSKSQGVHVQQRKRK